MRPIPLSVLGLLVGLAFPAGGVLLGATGPVRWLLGAVPLLLASLGWVLGSQASELEARRGELQRAARARRDEAERTSAELSQRAKGLVAAVAALTSSTEETAAGVRDTSATMSRLASTATASALTAETVVGLALESERAAARGLAIAEQSREALTRLAQEVQALSQLIAGLDDRMQDVFRVADAVAQIAERSRSLSAMAKAQAQSDGGILAPEAFPALVARMDGHAEETAAAAARAKGILDEVRGAMTGAVEAAEAGSVRAGEGAMVIEGAAATLRDLARALATSAQAGRDIAGVAQQQESGFEQVMHAMNGIFLASERTSTSTREVATEARALGDLAGRLRRAVRPDV
jgi:methyl-accepting chemotaxis protein